MRFWVFVKLVAALAVVGVMVLTGLLAYHVTVRPLALLEPFIPNPAEIFGQADVEFAKMLDSAELPDVEPGERAFAKAHELIALGELAAAREKLTAIVNVYPNSNAAPLARRIVGEMNLDEVLSAAHMEGKRTHTVKPGDSYFKIAGEHHTSLDLIMHLNGLLELRNLQPGDDLIILPLEFRILIEPNRMAVSLWDSGRFLREYPIIHLGHGGAIRNQVTVIDSKSAIFNGRSIQPQARSFRVAEKSLQLAKSSLRIGAFDDAGDERPRGIYLRPVDLEELFLLTRVGNAVEIRNPAPQPK
jgi:LysM repeat protein